MTVGPERIIEMGFAFWASKVLLSAVELGLFTELAAGPQARQPAMDHSTTLAGDQPIFALDMYEHSYPIDYGAQAAAYVDAFMPAINWPSIAAAYARVAPVG